MKKSNDNIPTDEMLLAMALQNAGAYEMGWCMGAYYEDAGGRPVDTYAARERARKCCAVGALRLTDDTKMDDRGVIFRDQVIQGNDNSYDLCWRYSGDDYGESLGWAYRQAMTIKD